MTDRDMKHLDDLLAKSAASAPVPSPDLMARVLADAATLQPRTTPVVHPKRSLIAQMLDMIGGWPALGGLATAGIAGLWIGVAPPFALETLAADVWGTTAQVDLMGSTTIFDEVFDG